ncbi:DUF6223 family protein [Sanguibacter sp. 25GB23B1]|uniref:DUF6223 family protein n=1 Tax=unclassified Sanguibacter TaxID=2645534 RepID=UPI0032AF8882
MSSSQILAYELGSGRLVPTTAAVVGLLGVVAGVLAQARASTPHPRVLVLALSLGTIAVLMGGLHAANAAGGLGTGNGLAGGVIAVILGIIAALLGGLPLRRAAVRRSE